MHHLVAGPMLGPPEPGAATIWLWLRDRTKLAQLGVSSGVLGAPRDLVAPGLRAAVDALHPGSAIVAIPVTAPGPQITLRLGATPIGTVTVKPAPAPAATGTVEIVAGSCANLSEFAGAPVYGAMAATAPDLALLLGDNCYYVGRGHLTQVWALPPRDWGSTTRMLARQLEARTHADFAPLAASVPCLATWDDHDFGYNNAAGHHPRFHWVGRDASAQVFRAMWPNPYALATGAVYHAQRLGPVEVFVTDSRFEMDPCADRIWGAAQQAWLLAALRASTAPVKIVAVGLQLLHQTRRESFKHDAPTERLALLDALLGVNAPPIPGRTLILAGDAHHAQLLRWSTTPYSPVIEVTASPIRHPELGLIGSPGEPDTRLWSVRADSFTHLRVDVTGPNQGTVAIRMLDASGNVLDDAGRPCASVWDLQSAMVY